jgi:hypothetical protein
LARVASAPLHLIQLAESSVRISKIRIERQRAFGIRDRAPFELETASAPVVDCANVKEQLLDVNRWNDGFTRIRRVVSRSCYRVDR